MTAGADLTRCVNVLKRWSRRRQPAGSPSVRPTALGRTAPALPGCSGCRAASSFPRPHRKFACHPGHCQSFSLSGPGSHSLNAPVTKSGKQTSPHGANPCTRQRICQRIIVHGGLPFDWSACRRPFAQLCLLTRVGRVRAGEATPDLTRGVLSRRRPSLRLASAGFGRSGGCQGGPITVRPVLFILNLPSLLARLD